MLCKHMKFIKTNEAISLSNKKIISNFDKLIDRIDTEYNSGDWKTIRYNAHLFTGRSKKDIIKNTTLIISNKEYKIVLTLTLLKEGLDRIQRLIAKPSISVNINISSKIKTEIGHQESNWSRFDGDIDYLLNIKNIIENSIKMLTNMINKDSSVKDFYDEYDEETITDYLWDLRDLLNGNFKISKFKYGKGFIFSIVTGKNLPYIERQGNHFFEINDNYVNTLVELNNISKTLKNIGLNLRYSIEQLKGGTIYVIITEADQ